MSSPEVEALCAAWRGHPPAPIRVDELVAYLVDTYSAYENPLATIPRSDLEADEEVHEDDAARLLTITDPSVLPELFDEFDIELIEGQRQGDPAWLEEDRRFLFEVPAEIGFRLLNIEQSRGLRVTVLIEAQHGIATSFRVYNLASKLIADLTARIGPTSLLGARVGDIRDESFADYLRQADRRGLLQR